MLLHANCVARDGEGVLILGPPGSGKSDLSFRLLRQGWALVADDQVEVDREEAGGRASAPTALAGLLELRGLGIVRMPHLPAATLRLAVRLGPGERLPPSGEREHGLPRVHVDPACASAPDRVALALDCALGRQAMLAGAFAA